MVGHVKTPTKTVVVGYIGVPTNDGRVIVSVVDLVDLGPSVTIPARLVRRRGAESRGPVEVSRRGPELVVDVPWWWLGRPHLDLTPRVIDYVKDPDGPERVELRDVKVRGVTYVPDGMWAWQGIDAWRYVREHST